MAAVFTGKLLLTLPVLLHTVFGRKSTEGSYFEQGVRLHLLEGSIYTHYLEPAVVVLLHLFMYVLSDLHHVD